MKRLWFYFIYLLLVWGSFRYFVHLPDVVEELWFKPVIWLVPLFWWNLSLRGKIELFGNKWLETFLWGLGMAMLYWLVIRKVNFSYSGVSLDILGVSIATAITEEVALSGFVTTYIKKYVRDTMETSLLVGLMTAVLRLPIVIFVYKLSPDAILGVFLIAGASGMMNSWIKQRTNNVTGSIIARVGLNLALLG